MHKKNVTPHLYRAMTSRARRSNQGQIVNLIHVRSRSLSHEQFPFETADSQNKSIEINEIQSNTNIKGSNKLQKNKIGYVQQQHFDKYRPTALLRTMLTDNLKQQTFNKLSLSPHTKNELQKLNVEISSNKQIINKIAPINSLCIKNSRDLESESSLSNQKTTLHPKNNIWENVELNTIPTLPNYVDNSPTIGR